VALCFSKAGRASCYPSSVTRFHSLSATTFLLRKNSPLLVNCFALIALPNCSLAQQGQFDGPAELPRVYVRSAIADTPATGRTISVHSGENLQQVIDSAKCGDRIELQAGSAFTTGVLRLPEKPCDDSHWIIVRTSAPDSALPPEGTRLKPCFAGVASLPGRPDFRCSSTRNVLARIEFNGKSGSGPLLFAPGANHYRFIGLEITRTGGPIIYALANAGGNVNHLIFDRVWMHGTPQDETTRAINLSAMSQVAVVDSSFSDFHCISVSGTCTDAQVLGTGGGNVPTGPFKIVNNFLEASGENILFGGGPATMTPADIEVRGNHFFKPMIWRLGEPGFAAGASGHPFIVKNLFELKNAQRVLVEGNLFENCWGGFSQNGYAILLTPKNQSNQCPLCRVTDITLRYNRITNVGAVLEMANIRSDAGGETTAGERYSIHDIVADNVRGQPFGGGAGLFAQILVAAPPLRDVNIEHVTAFAPRAVFSIMNRDKFSNFKIENNIFSTGQYSVLSAGGGPQNCAFRPDPGSFFKNCFVNSSFTHNLMIGEGGWPPGNSSVKDARSAGIHEASGQDATPYLLCADKDNGECKKPSSALHAGTDAKNLGADMEKLQQMLANVR
jgi:hypothetical protein